jgi:hypothetical protein
MRRRAKLCDRGHLDKVRRAVILVLQIVPLLANSAGAFDPNDPCRGSLLRGSRLRFSCPELGRIPRTLNSILAQSVGRSSPLIAASAGFVYRYDPESDAFERETAVPGQLYLETPRPVGKRRLNVSVSYQRVAFDSLDGQDLDGLRDTHPPVRIRVDSSAGPFIVPVQIASYAIEAETHQLTLSATYGVTSDLDVNLTVPVVYSTSSQRFRIRLPLGGAEACSAIPCAGAAHQSALGIGDVFLRGKLRLLDLPSAEIASGLVVRLPTGDEDDLHGAGSAQVGPKLYAAGASVPLTALLAFRPYLNAGIDVDVEDLSRSEGRWGVGADLGIAQRATFGLAVLGRHPFSRTGSAHVFDVPRCGRLTDAACARGPSAPLFGLANDRPDFYDLSVGFRVNLWRDVLIGFANALVPLNDAGFRADVIPMAGIEGAF